MYKRLDEHPGGICSGDQDIALLDAFSTYFHETIHWWQHIGSTTGLLLSLSPILQTHINYEYLKSILQNIGPQKPLKTLAEKPPGTFRLDIENNLNRVVNNWYDLEFNRRVLLNPKSLSDVLANPFFDSQGHSIQVGLANLLLLLAATFDSGFTNVPHPRHPTVQTRKPVRFMFPAKVYWGISAACFFATLVLWIVGQYGGDFSGFLSVFIFYPVGVWHICKGYWAYDQQAEEKALRDLVYNPTFTDGKAQFAKNEDLKAMGLDKSSGLFLGSLNGQNIYYPGETHLLTIAPPGAGKGTSIVIPNLLTYPGSVIVTDPKGELYAITARHRQDKLGHKIIVLCPWAKKLSAELGMEIPDHGFNPLGIIQPGSDIKDEAELISSLLLPGSANMKADDEFWIEGGQSLLTAFMLQLKSQEETLGPLTLPLLRHYLHLPPEELTAVLFAMSKNENFGGCIREYGGKLLGTAERSPKQFEGLLGSAQKALRIYDSISPLGEHVSHGEIDFKALIRSMPLEDAFTKLILVRPISHRTK